MFASIYLKHHPHKMQELLQYMFNIRESANSKGGFAWRAYDELFRMRQASQPTPWSHINPDLWWRCTLGLEVNQTQSSLTKSTTSRATCNYFNQGVCRFNNCRFSHTCSGCGGQHQQTHCPNSKGQTKPSSHIVVNFSPPPFSAPWKTVRQR